MKESEIKKTRDMSQITLFAICVIAYTCSYLSRDTFSATMPNIISSTGVTKADMAIVSTIFLIFYGAGQLLSGVLGDRFRANRLVAIGLLGSSICNYLFSTSSTILQMSIFWGLNGLCLSFLWSPIIKLLSTRLDENYRYKFVVNVSLSMPVGTLLAFFLSAFFIRNYSFRTAFFVNFLIILSACFLWLLCFSKIKLFLPEHIKETDDTSGGSSTSTVRLFVISGLFFIIAAVMCNGIIRNGVAIWVPTYLTDVFKLEEFVSVLTATIIPIVNLSGIYIASFIFKKTRNESSATSIMFTCSLCFLVLLVLIGGLSPILSVVFLALTSSFMQGATAIIMSIMPMQFRKYNKVATVTGCLNANGYIAASIGSYATGVLATSYGWNATIIFWLILSALGATICLLARKKWANFITTT